MITKREIIDKKSQIPEEGSLDNNFRNDTKSKGFSMIEVAAGRPLLCCSSCIEITLLQ
ncbi:hypothetical protein ES703_61141 [subsurface metagenome]